MSIPIVPNTIAGGAEVDLTWATSVSTSEGGVAGRKSLRKTPQRQFHLTIGPDQAQEIAAIYRASNGPRYPVAIRDWSDYQFTNQELVWLVAGGNTYAQLSITYQAPFTYAFQTFSGEESLSYPILLPDESETPITILVNNSPLESWVLQDFGVVQIAGVLSSGDVVTASGEYLVPCCFLADELTIKQITGFVASIDTVDLREILLPELQQLLADVQVGS
jgi:hypothetical protein